MDPADRRHPALERLQRHKERHADRGRASRFGIAAAGIVLVVVGIVIIPVPGPWSLPMILFGLALLALEFDWAERSLVRAVERAEAAKNAAAEATRAQKALGVVVVFVLALTALGLAVVLWDIPILPG